MRTSTCLLPADLTLSTVILRLSAARLSYRVVFMYMSLKIPLQDVSSRSYVAWRRQLLHVHILEDVCVSAVAVGWDVNHLACVSAAGVALAISCSLLTLYRSHVDKGRCPLDFVCPVSDHLVVRTVGIVGLRRFGSGRAGSAAVFDCWPYRRQPARQQ